MTDENDLDDGEVYRRFETGSDPFDFGPPTTKQGGAIEAAAGVEVVEHDPRETGGVE